MRLIVLLLLVSFSASAQNYDTTKYFRSKDFGWQWKGGKFDTALLAPRDTVVNKRGIAQIGSTLYVGNGTKWTAAGGTVDTTILSTRAWRQKGIDSLAALSFYNSNGTLSGNRTVNGNNKLLKFTDNSNFEVFTNDTLGLTAQNSDVNITAGGDINLNGTVNVAGNINATGASGYVNNINGSLSNNNFITKKYADSLNAIIPSLSQVTAVGNSTTLDSILINGMKVGYNSILNTTYYGTSTSSNSTASNSSYIGENAGNNNRGNFVTALGSNSARSNLGFYVTAIGTGAASGNTFDSTIHFGINTTDATAKNQVIFNTGKGNYRLGLLNQTGGIDRTIANASGTEVLSVNSQTANSSGAITLTAANVGALGTGDSSTAILSNFTSIGRVYKVRDSMIAVNNLRYLPLTGGTLTGALTGTTGTFSGAINSNTLTASRIPYIGTNGALRTNSLLAYDSATGRILVGTTSSRNVGGAARLFQIEGTASAPPGVTVVRNSADASGPIFYFGKSRNASVGANTIVQNADVLGILGWAGSDGSSLDNLGASIAAIVDGTPSSGFIPAQLDLRTTSSGSLPTTRLTVKSDGKVGIATTTPTALLDVNSDVLRLRTAKTPSSATDTGNAGDFCWDANYLYICIATNTWRRLAHATW